VDEIGAEALRRNYAFAWHDIQVLDEQVA